MPVYGERKSTANMGRGYASDPINKYAAAFKECVTDILTESGINLYTEPQKAVMLGSSKNALKSFFVENAYDPNEIQTLYNEDAEYVMNDLDTMQEAQFENDCEAITEAANPAAYNPVIGMTFPIHKNIMMNNVFDKGAIPKVVAAAPKFTISMETRLLVTPDGQEIDVFKEQYKIRDAIDNTAPFHTVELTLPENANTDILTAIHATDADNLSIESYVSAVKLTGVYLAAADINPETGLPAGADGQYDIWVPTHLAFSVSYGEYDRTLMERVAITGRDDKYTDTVVTEDVLSGYMKKNKVMLVAAAGKVTAVRLAVRLDTSSAMLRTCSVSWRVRTDLVEIPSAIPINTTVSPEEVKDIGALYNVNQLSKILSLMKTVLGTYKDDKIKQHLDESFKIMDDTAKVATTFDFAPRGSYALDHVEWRYKTFMDFLDTVVTCMLQVLNDPNMTVSIFGSPEIIRKITPTEYTYQTPSNVGPVDLDFVKTVTTSDKRVYQFVGSDKLRGNTNLIIILCPRNSERIIYRIYDYQMYVSNEIRNMDNYALPAIHAFERWKFVEYQPVQARIKINHPTGLTEIAPNDDPYGVSSYNDFSMLK